ncbi:MAG: hypothetical protein IPL74_14945 [Bacteroidetes bacterium]|nr:hypothetical protein [Bacteroidota bacterium]
MKTFNSTFVIIFTFIASISFTSCEKGDTGAPGPQGPIGPPGNVNVISKTVTVSSGDWISYSNPLGGNMKGSQKSVPEITSSIVSTGAVMVYLRQSYNTGDITIRHCLSIGLWIVITCGHTTLAFLLIC